MTLPNFMVVGVQRGGTTYLSSLLRQHPQIYLPELRDSKRPSTKDVRYFEKFGASDVDLDISDYAKHFQNQIDETAIGEVSTSNTYFEWIPGLIAEHLGNIRLIFLLRNPVNRAYSHYWQQLIELTGKEYLSFEQALGEEPRRIVKSYGYRYSYSYVDRGFYMRQINRFLPLFSRDKMLFLVSEEFYANTQRHMRGICKFLDVDESFEFALKIYRHHMPLPKNLFLYRQLKHIQVCFSEQRGLWRVSRPIRQLLRRMPKTVTHYPPMKLKTRSYLRGVFDADVQSLAEYLGRDLYQLWFQGL